MTIRIAHQNDHLTSLSNVKQSRRDTLLVEFGALAAQLPLDSLDTGDLVMLIKDMRVALSRQRRRRPLTNRLTDSYLRVVR